MDRTLLLAVGLLAFVVVASGCLDSEPGEQQEVPDEPGDEPQPLPDDGEEELPGDDLEQQSPEDEQQEEIPLE